MKIKNKRILSPHNLAYFLFLPKIQGVRSRIFLLRTGFILPLFLICFSAFSQNLVVDSTKIVELNKQEEEKVHSPHKASLYSAILPGLGQAYNKKYWKIPLIYAGFGALGYSIHWNNKNYQTMKLAYSDFTDKDPETNSYLDLAGAEYYDFSIASDSINFKTALGRQQDYFRRNRDLLVITTFLFYGLNIIDASVDAHFFDFDISEDLSFNWQPMMYYYNDETIYGIRWTLTF